MYIYEDSEDLKGKSLLSLKGGSWAEKSGFIHCTSSPWLYDMLLFVQIQEKEP